MSSTNENNKHTRLSVQIKEPIFKLNRQQLNLPTRMRSPTIRNEKQTTCGVINTPERDKENIVVSMLQTLRSNKKTAANSIDTGRKSTAMLSRQQLSMPPCVKSPKMGATAGNASPYPRLTIRTEQGLNENAHRCKPLKLPTKNALITLAMKMSSYQMKDRVERQYYQIELNGQWLRLADSN